MKILKITIQNIGPYGKKLNTIELNPEGGMWMVVGKNGAGKSTLIKSPKFLFYGKDDKIKKDDIANRINKKGVVSGICEKSPTELVKIERSFSPSGLKVSLIKDGVETDITRVGINENQGYIENEVVRMPYNIFSNVVSLSINDFTSFLKMTPDEKRKIIDRIFGLDDINIMAKVVKDKLRDLKNDRQSKMVHINANLANIERNKLAKEESLKRSQTDDTFNTLSAEESELKSLVQNNTTTFNLLQNEYNSLVVEDQKCNTEIQTVNTAIYQLQTAIGDADRRLSVLSTSTCPTCNATMNRADIDAEKENIISFKTTNTNQYQQYVSVVNVIKERSQKIQSEINEKRTTLSNLSNSINEANQKIQIIQYKLKNMNQIKDQFDDLILQLIEENNGLYTSIDEINHQVIVYENLDILYGANGVKKTVLESYIPSLNQELEETLYDLNFPYNLSFNTSFNPVLTSLGREISTDTLSTGEMKRADIAVLISFIKMMICKYPQLNVFMLDEILSSIDQEGVSDIISYLQQIVKKLKINLFLVNHSPLPYEYFDNIITITKNGSFSDMIVEKL